MTDINHRRKNKKAVFLRHAPHEYNNGVAMQPRIQSEENDRHNVGRTDYLNKQFQVYLKVSTFADVSICTHIGASYCKSHRGMSKCVKGAKKYLNSRIRFHEKMKLNKLVNDYDYN